MKTIILSIAFMLMGVLANAQPAAIVTVEPNDGCDHIIETMIANATDNHGTQFSRSNKFEQKDCDNLWKLHFEHQNWKADAVGKQYSLDTTDGTSYHLNIDSKRSSIYLSVSENSPNSSIRTTRYLGHAQTFVRP